MKVAADSHRASQWVGTMRLGATPEFIRFYFDATRPILLDRPQHFQFQIPLLDVKNIESTLSFRAGELTFTGSIAGEQITGTVANSIVQGSFACRSVQDLVPQLYSRLLGTYHLAPDRSILLSRDIREEALYFYVDGEHLIRLHPLSAEQFFSERCETMMYQLDAQGQIQSLRWQALDQHPIDALPANAYREETLAIPVDDYMLAGRLLLPPTDGPHPAVILCHLANTHQRDYYRLFAAPFVQRGIAACIYDKRGWGDSTGTRLFSQIFQLTDDASAIFRYLQHHPALRSEALGLWGISNGAWVAPLTAARVGNAAFVIGASVAGVSPARQEQFRRANVARALGASPRAVALIEQLWGQLFQFAIDGQWTDELEATLLEVYSDAELQQLPKHPEHGPSLQPVPPLTPIADIRADWAGAWAEGGFDPAPVYASLSCPIFCVWGEHDTVLPVEESMQRLQHALEERKHPDYRLQTIPRATHNLYVTTPDATGMLTETMHTQLHNVAVAPHIRDEMAAWAARSTTQPRLHSAPTPG
jgi:pimeloyl-ACP methyl ester carboxylesterase